MSSLPKLVYFDSPGRADALRILFDIGGVEFEDVRLSRAQFEERKAAGEFPYGLVPVLIVGDRTIAETAAIGRYVARLAGLHPDDPLEAAYVDQLVDHIQEIVDAIVLPYICEELNAEPYGRRLGETILPKMLGDMDRQLEQRAGPFSTGVSITLADLMLASILDWIGTGTIPGVPADLVARFPRLTQTLNAVNADPAVQASKAKAPVKGT